MKPSDLLTKQDLQDFKTELLDELEKRIETTVANTTMRKKWLRTDEVAAYLSISTSQVSNLKYEGILKCKKLGGTNYFNKQGIDKYLSD